jgi:hypothetical protein
MVSQERRKFQRLEDGGLSLKLEGFDSITHTLNISPSGVYCKVDKPLPLMARVRLKLMIPDTSKEKGPAKNLEVSGIVVRQHPVIIDGAIKHYDIAVFFDDLSAKDKETISDYIANKKDR